jgi:hypothetical protein
MKNPDEELRKALRGHSRRRDWRWWGCRATVPIAFLAAWWLDFGRTDTLIVVVGAFMLMLLGDTEIRLKAMQLKLAMMADQLDRVSGNEPEGHLLLELSDW